MEREIELRACCGKLRWALLDAIEPLPDGTKVNALRWGPTLVPLDVETAPDGAPAVVDAIIRRTERWLGAKSTCLSGRGVLVVSAEQ
ncbi:MAG TPA: hypothetical protein VHL53_05230 [Acidimicrobiia bacterium]|nr:hypothetical protein [Acidimicrobiia bacterium]